MMNWTFAQLSCVGFVESMTVSMYHCRLIFLNLIQLDSDTFEHGSLRMKGFNLREKKNVNGTWGSFSSFLDLNCLRFFESHFLSDANSGTDFF